MTIWFKRLIILNVNAFNETGVLEMKSRFYSKENMEHIKESMQQLREGKIVQKTIEELEAMESEEQDSENN